MPGSRRPLSRAINCGSPPATEMPNSEWFAFATSLVDRALEWAKADSTALPWLVEALSTVGPDEANRIIEFLEAEVGRGDLDEDGRLALFEQVREVAARHERFQTADWAMPAERRTRLSSLAELLQPADDLRRFAYLFNWHPELSDADLTDYGDYSTELEAKRREALDVLLARPDGWEQLAAVAARAEAPTQVGWAAFNLRRGRRARHHAGVAGIGERGAPASRRNVGS